MNKPLHKGKRDRNLDAETKIMLGLVAVFFSGTAALYISGGSVTLTAVCTGLTVTALLYRFLGGVEGSFLKLATFKAAGSVAVWVAVTWFVYDGLIEENLPIQPSPKSWIAIDKDGKQVAVKIGRETHKKDLSKFLSGADWGVKLEDKTIRITNGEDSLGKISFASLDDQLKISDRIKMDPVRDIRFTRPLSAGTEADLNPLYAYKILSGQYTDNYNGFSVLDENNEEIYKGDPPLRTKQFQFFEHQGNNFMIFVSQAIHNDFQSEPWAIFGFAQVEPTLNWVE